MQVKLSTDKNQSSSAYARELGERYLAPALDLIKRSLPLGELKGFHRALFTLNGQKFITNIPFMMTECTTLVSKTADVLRCRSKDGKVHMDVARIQWQQGFVQSLQNNKNLNDSLAAYDREKIHQTQQVNLPNPAETSVQNYVSRAVRQTQSAFEQRCQNLAAAYNTTPALRQAFNCRITLAQPQPAHRIFLQKEGADIYEVSVWYEDRAMESYFKLTPMITLHSIRQLP